MVSKSRLRASLGVVLAYAFIFDYVIYVAGPGWNWPEVFRKPNQVRLLVVADPRLSLSPGLLEWPSAWDSERFVRRTFRAAVEHVQPHAVAFLGDLFTEPPGLPSSNVTWPARERFHNVFALNASIASVVLPGELDIGWDIDDPYTKDMERVFRQEFGAVEPRQVAKDFELYPVDWAVYEQLPRGERKPAKGSVRVMLSHAPVIPLLDVRLNRTLALASPDVIFSAHELSSALVRAARQNPTDFASMVNAEQGQLERHVVSREDYLEFVVPSCSSRVTHAPGFGVALFTMADEPAFDYAVLWTPARTLHLWGYVVIGGYALVILVVPLGQLTRVRWTWRINFVR